jgi:hypothetical protein
MRGKAVTPWLLAMAIGSSGCATDIPVATDSFCQAYQPVYVDRQLDTQRTIDQVDANNGAYVCACNHDCPEVTQ